MGAALEATMLVDEDTMGKLAIREVFQKLDLVDKAEVLSELATILASLLADEQSIRMAQSKKKRVVRSRLTRRFGDPGK